MIMKRYSPTGRRNHGRPLKRHLDTWDRNGSTSGPTPWQIDDDDDFVSFCKLCILIVILTCMLCSVYSLPPGILRLPWLFFPCFFLSCKANARVYLAKTGHGPHSS
jgi:hypothetical protein